MANLIEQLHAGCGGSLGCQLLHQRAAEALGKMRKVLEDTALCLDVAAKILDCRGFANTANSLCKSAQLARQAIQDTLALDGPNDGASLYAAARAMAEHDWKDELVRDVWAELHPWEQEYYLDHARIGRGGTAVRGEG